MSGTGPISGPPARPDGRADGQHPADPGDGAGGQHPAGDGAGGQPGWQHPANPDGMVGVLLSGRYRLDQRIAAGGMGEVWRGTDQVLGRPVAIKLLRHAYIGDEALASRFRAEARYAASLSHPGIAQVFDYGEQDAGTGSGSGGRGAYLVMELVPGEPLSAILARTGHLSPEVTLDIIAQAASALQAAHTAGIVHRDIKPGNLLVTAEGRVKITDFGIARAMQAAQAGHLTQTGMVMGTAQYVSPEQASGLRVTHASDIYSLGVVAYECLAGAPPFAADALIALALAHVREVPPPLPPTVPPLVTDMVMRMLAKRPEERPASAQLVADRANALRDALPATSGPDLAEMASEDTAAFFADDAATGPRLHDSATTQLPMNDPERLTPTRHRSAHRRALVVAAVSLAIIAVGGVTTALMVAGRHAAGSPSSTPTPRPSQHTHQVVSDTPSQNPPAASPPAPNPTGFTGPTAFPGPTAPALPSPAFSAAPSPILSVSPTPTQTLRRTSTTTPTPTATLTASPTPPTTPSSATLSTDASP